MLGVERTEGTWIGAPREDLQLAVGDVVVLYGRQPMLEDIAARAHGAEGDEASQRFREWHAASPVSKPLTPARWAPREGAFTGNGFLRPGRRTRR